MVNCGEIKSQECAIAIPLAVHPPPDTQENIFLVSIHSFLAKESGARSLTTMCTFVHKFLHCPPLHSVDPKLYLKLYPEVVDGRPGISCPTAGTSSSYVLLKDRRLGAISTADE